MFRDSIIEHAGRVSEMLEAYPDIATGEAQTKNSLIEPLLRCLGYDPSHPEQVALEVSTELGGKIDYVLTGQGNVKIAVEAKKAAGKLSEKETNQLRSYFTFSEVIAGILTNGVQYWLFTDLDKTNVMDARPYKHVDLRDLTDNDIQHLETLARGHVKQNAVHEQAQRELYRMLVNEIVTQEFDTPSQEFLRLIGKKAGIKPLTKPNLRMLEPLVGEAISRNRVTKAGPDSTSERPTLEGADKAPTTHPSLTPSEKAALTRKRFQGATLFDKPLDCKNYAQMLKEVVRALQNRHRNDFAERVRKEPFFKENRNRQYISTSKGAFLPGDRISKVGEHFLYTNLSRNNSVRRARLFLSEFGYNPEELVIHTSED